MPGRPSRDPCRRPTRARSPERRAAARASRTCSCPTRKVRRYRPSGRDVEADIMQDFRSVDAIAERDMVELDVAADRRQPRAAGRIGRLDRGVENVTQAQNRQPRLVKVLPYLRETQHRGAHPASKDVEGHELANRQAAVDDELSTEIEETGGDDLAD